MQHNDTHVANVVAGLKALVDSAFPKTCGCCGKEYVTVDQLITETEDVSDSPENSPEHSPENSSEITPTPSNQVVVARRCPCGGTLQLQFEDRRAQGEIADKRRNLFGHLLEVLVEGGMPPGMAKTEIMKVMRGEPSKLLTTEQLQRLFADQ